MQPHLQHVYKHKAVLSLKSRKNVNIYFLKSKYKRFIEPVKPAENFVDISYNPECRKKSHEFENAETF